MDSIYIKLREVDCFQKISNVDVENPSNRCSLCLKDLLFSLCHCIICCSFLIHVSSLVKYVCVWNNNILRCWHVGKACKVMVELGSVEWSRALHPT